MGDESLIRTFGDYSKPSHEGYKNTIELPVGNNVFFPPRRTTKLRNDILMLHQHHGESLSEAWTRFKDLLQKSPSSWHRPLAPKDLVLYDNESWNDPSDFAKPIKEIALPQDVPNTSDCRLIELENQVQHLMEAHLAPTQPTQVNKVTTLCNICSGPCDTQYCMKDIEEAFVEYASSRALPSDTVKNLKLSTSLVLSARSYLKIDPQCSSHPSTSINAIKAHSKEANISQTSLLRPRMEIETQQLEEPEPTLEDEY
ncbi:MAK10-like protein [Tanacetum coccineum]